jgi:hypothetical protein
MSTYLVHYAAAQHRSAAGFGGEWDADRRHGSRRAKASRQHGRVWARLRGRIDGLTPAPAPRLAVTC